VLLARTGNAAQIYCELLWLPYIRDRLAAALGLRLSLRTSTAPPLARLPLVLRRWHMTLSRFPPAGFLYIPLGGNRGGTLRTFVT